MMNALFKRPAAHVGQRGDLNRAALGMLLDFLDRQHVVQRILERAKVRRDFFVKIARQKTQRFAGLHGGTRQNNSRHLAVPQRRERHRHGQIRLARARRSDAERHVVGADGVEIFFLADGFGGDAGFPVVRHHAVAHQVLEGLHAVMFHDVQSVGKFAVADGRAGLQQGFQRDEQVFGAFQGVGRAFQFDPAFARGGLDAQFAFERLEVARFMVEQLLREPRVFKMKGFSCHIEFI